MTPFGSVNPPRNPFSKAPPQEGGNRPKTGGGQFDEITGEIIENGGSTRCCRVEHRLVIEGTTKCTDRQLPKSNCETTLTVQKWVGCGTGCPGDSDEARAQEHKCGYKPCEFTADETESRNEIKFKYWNQYTECYEVFGVVGTSANRGLRLKARQECRHGSCGRRKPWTKTIKHKCCPDMDTLGTIGALERSLWMCGHYYFTKGLTIGMGMAVGLPFNPITISCSERDVQEYTDKLNYLKQLEKHKKINPDYSLHYECVLGLVREYMGKPTAGDIVTKLDALAGGMPPPIVPLTNADLLGGTCPCLTDKQMGESAVNCCKSEPSVPTGKSKFEVKGKFPCKAISWEPKTRGRPTADKRWFNNVMKGECPKQ